MPVYAGRLTVWFKLSLFCLTLVAIYGMLMRYKIAFDFPFFDQKNLLHAHSHFAFSGWISHVLYCGLALLISAFVPAEKCRKYNVLIAINIFCAFGMLIAFTVQGYKLVSILFSTLTIIVGVVFAWWFIKDADKMPVGHPSKPWAIAGLLLNVLASAGPFTLAYLMMSKLFNHELYLASVYYYLHFQYNGWFFFGIMAIIAGYLKHEYVLLRKCFRLFAITVIPTFFLSTLWANMPAWLYWVMVAATMVQLAVWLIMFFRLIPSVRALANNTSGWIIIFFYVSALAITIKFLLQAISVHPDLSQLVFGFRPIVIAYLHLVLLGGYSLFLIGYLFAKGFVKPSGVATVAAFVFLGGVMFNELILAAQGFAAFSYLLIPYVNELLLGAAIMLFVGAAGFLLAAFKKQKTETDT